MASTVSKSPIKVVHLCSSESGGAGKAAFRLHHGLLGLGIDSTLLVLIKGSSEPTVTLLSQEQGKTVAMQTPGISPSWKEAGIRWARLMAEHPLRPQGLEMYSDEWSSVDLSNVPAVRDADIVNLHWMSGMLDYEQAARVFAGKKVIWTLHDMNPFTGGCHYAGECTKFRTACSECPQLGPGGPDDLAQRVWTKKKNALRAVDLTIVTPSRWLGKQAGDSAIFNGRTVAVIPNGIPEQVYRPYPKSEIRRALNIPEDASVILFGADNVLNTRKGFIYLLRALAQFRAPQGERIVLATFGGIDPSIEIPSPYEVLNLGSFSEDRQLAYIYSLADLLVIPSLEDNLPNTVLESMACGVPVVGFAIGGIPDMVRKGETGLLASPGDVQQLADSIYKALFQMDRGKTSKRCREIVLRDYTEEVQATRYLSLYQSLLDNDRSTAGLDNGIEARNKGAASCAPVPDADHMIEAPWHQKPLVGCLPEVMIRTPLPRISMVTASYNQGMYLEECIDSILSQNYPNLEYVIMDGGSIDNSLSIIKKYEKHLSYWQSRRDGGQYEAIDEGFRRTSGDVMGWLNSDDKLHPGALLKVSYFFSKYADIEWLTGRPVTWDARGNISTVDNFLQPLSRRKYLDYNFDKPYIQQESTFWRRSLWARAGGRIRTDMKLAGDMELWLRFFRHALLYSVDTFIGGYRYHGNQKAVLQAQQYVEEAQQTIKEEISSGYNVHILPPPPQFLEPETKDLLSFIRLHGITSPISLDSVQCWRNYCDNLLSFIDDVRTKGNLRMAPLYHREALFLETIAQTECTKVVAEANRIQDSLRKTQALMEEAEKALFEGNLDSAESHAKSCLRIDVMNTDAYNLLGIIYWKKGIPANALQALSDALKTDMYNSRVVVNLITILVEVGDKDTATGIAEFYRERNPDDHETMEALSRLMLQ